MSSSVNIYQTGSATATFSIGDGPQYDKEPCSSILLVMASANGWSAAINLSWTDPQGNNWGFMWDGNGSAQNTPVFEVQFIEIAPAGNYLGYWGEDQANVPAQIDWVTVPSGWVGTWILSLNASNIPSTLNSSGPSLTVKFVSVNVDVVAGSVQPFSDVAAEDFKALAAKARAEFKQRLSPNNQE
jgi:hypothetical protein